jgi:hypothetical protein
MVFGNFGVFAEDIYLECESIDQYRDSTAWINNSCLVTKKVKFYYEIHNDGWKKIQRNDTKLGRLFIKPNGDEQICGSAQEPFEMLIERAKKTGKAINYNFYEGAERRHFFEEYSGVEVTKSSNEDPVIFLDNEIILKSLIGKALKKELQEVAVFERINRLTGEVTGYAGRKDIKCEPISMNQYQKMMKDWDDGFKKIKEAEQNRKKF